MDQCDRKHLYHPPVHPAHPVFVNSERSEQKRKVLKNRRKSPKIAKKQLKKKMVYCCVPNCFQNYKTDSAENIWFYRFPQFNKEQFELWISLSFG